MNKNHRKINSNPIAFLDSGIGGLPYLRWIKERLPEETYIYLADRQHFPYGEKPAEKVVQHVVDAVNLLIEAFSPKVIVIACNTASVLALSVLRDTFPMPFIGVVPAVKPAAENSHNKKIGVIGSNRTVRDAYTENLISSFARGCSVFPVSAGPVIDFVENSFLTATDTEKQDIVSPTMALCGEKGIDTVVLGCTHFLFLEQEFYKAAGKEMRIIDSREGVGNQICRILDEQGFSDGKTTTDLLFHTGSAEAAAGYSSFAEKFGLEYRGAVMP